jgi:hypothetical protein
MSVPDPPTLVIKIRIEERPAVYVVSTHEGQSTRLMDWVLSHEDYADLLWRAVELAEEQPAA